jgi:hypothetical protein
MKYKILQAKHTLTVAWWMAYPRSTIGSSSVGDGRPQATFTNNAKWKKQIRKSILRIKI